MTERDPSTTPSVRTGNIVSTQHPPLPVGKITTSMAAYLYAVAAHSGQVDKQHQPYIQHLERVAGIIGNQFPGNAQYGIIAFLHDTLEDCFWLREDLGDRVSMEVWSDLLALTRKRGEDYKDYIERLCATGSNAAVAVKLADLSDHLRFGSWKVITPKHTEKYINAIRIIHGRMRRYELPPANTEGGE